jgi:hypothetical protein
MWAQCGGQGGADPAVCCPLSGSCTNVNEWCVPSGQTGAARLLLPALQSGNDALFWSTSIPLHTASDCKTSGQPAVRLLPAPPSYRYWQCQPSQRTPFWTPCEGKTKLNLWDQCGGINSGAGADAMDHTACCPVESYCLRVNAWYHQCVPGGGAPGAPPSSPLPPPPFTSTTIAYLRQTYRLPGATCAEIDVDAFTRSAQSLLQNVGGGGHVTALLGTQAQPAIVLGISRRLGRGPCCN